MSKIMLDPLCEPTRWIECGLLLVTALISIFEFFRSEILKALRLKRCRINPKFLFHAFIPFAPLFRGVADIVWESTCLKLMSISSHQRLLLAGSDYFFDLAYSFILVQWASVVHQNNKDSSVKLFISIGIILFCIIIPVVFMITILVLDALGQQAMEDILVAEGFYYVLLNFVVSLFFFAYGYFLNSHLSQISLKIKKVERNSSFEASPLLARESGDLNEPSSSFQDGSPIDRKQSRRSRKGAKRRKPQKHAKTTAFSKLRMKIAAQSIVCCVLFTARAVLYIFLYEVDLTQSETSLISLIRTALGEFSLTLLMLLLVGVKSVGAEEQKAMAILSGEDKKQKERRESVVEPGETGIGYENWQMPKESENDEDYNENADGDEESAEKAEMRFHEDEVTQKEDVEKDRSKEGADSGNEQLDQKVSRNEGRYEINENR
ncbi:uncharacterized protein MONOS_14538 [Monocercomonoides exilis]|uniref:uncharacterized protein n=1 Tax=Monocercomonoides exilis TaxID=2049356 RepID=UPI00355AC58B|nr:hypothetical protein MONOS_14538 [Monocercomonoides exilis]|eukprot:MONOS_14538.1-p1 / transcript=MONOS_14538.1 / gene=MONOS_14538 / organism=Monocercomonoides_exilis_PA203 / gene_product=unspecified product / transcript_product=unspecified product / location=Mono_scaffold01020:7110-8614(+) / protein_length=435 / sequence_SO=supercontig / SO=protein_coding / is_pseudo=false